MSLSHTKPVHNEQRVLTTSIYATLIVAALGIGLGVLSHSFSIAFDGMYALIDATMSLLALVVSRLIARDSKGEIRSRRFLMGFWHLEPMVLAFNGILLVMVSFYALINAIGLMLSGGNDLAFGWAVVYAVVVVAISLGVGLYEWRANRRLNSAFIRLDLSAWIMAGGITAALLVAFSIGLMIENTSLAWLLPYIDPAILALICIIIIPLPYQSIKAAIADIMLIAPPALAHEVHQICKAVVECYGFKDYTAYVAKVGRSKEIELTFILPEDFPAKPIYFFDSVREDISAQVGEEGPDRWLTVAFTADRKWSE